MFRTSSLNGMQAHATETNRQLPARDVNPLVPQLISLRTYRDTHPRAECPKRAALTTVAIARMSDKAIGDAIRTNNIAKLMN